MNIWIRSALIGLAATLSIMGIYGIINKKNTRVEFDARYELKASQDTNSTTPFSLTNVMGVLRERIETAGYLYEINSSANNTIRVSLFRLADSLSPVHVLTTPGRVGFWELYTIAELSDMLQAAVKLFAERNPSLPEEKPPVTVNKNISEEVTALLDSIRVNEKKEHLSKTTGFIEFNSPYIDQNTGLNVFPASIGHVKASDTAFTRIFLEEANLKKRAPADSRLCFGAPDKSISREKMVVPVYFLRTRGAPDRAPLKNEDIRDARPDLDNNNHPEIRLQFNKPGSRKWEAITSRNIGRSIAITIDGLVVSAPQVMSSITDGNSSISGTFTLAESQHLSELFMSSPLPAKLSLLSMEVKPVIKATGGSRKFLLPLIIFIACFGLVFFLSKTLGSSQTMTRRGVITPGK